MSSSPKRYNISYGNNNKARNYQPLIFKMLSVLVFGLIILTLLVGIFASGEAPLEIIVTTMGSNGNHTKTPIPHFPIVMEGPCEPQPPPIHCQSTDDSETVYFCTFRHRFGKVYVCIGDLRRWEEVIY
jgi:hypothetical protein